MFIKDKNLRQKFKNINQKHFLLKLILKNFNIFGLSRVKVVLTLAKLNVYHVMLSDRCVVSFNKKKFNKFVLYSRIILLKKIYEGKVIGFKKSIW
jgi:ribosomal protein S14